MKKSLSTSLVVVLFFVVLLIFGLYLNFSENVENWKTFLFVTVLGFLYYTSDRLIKSVIKTKKN